MADGAGLLPGHQREGNAARGSLRPPRQRTPAGEAGLGRVPRQRKIEERETSLMMKPRSRRRWPTIVLSLLVASLALALVGRAFLGPRDRESGVPSSGAARQVSGQAEDVSLECTVTVLTPSVELGDQVQTIFSYRNTGGTAYRLPIDGGTPRLLVYDSQGIQVYDTDLGIYDVAGIDSGSDLEEVLPGETLERESQFQAVWIGQLTIDPLCGYGIPGPTNLWADGERGVIDLPSLAVDVSVSGQRPDSEQALSRALELTHGLFEHCRPGPDGIPVDGIIAPPAKWQGRVLPSQEARCRAVLEEKQGFVAVDLLFAIPPDTGFPVELTDASQNRGLVLPTDRPMAQMGRWTFLVTMDEVIEFPGAAPRVITRGKTGLGVVVQPPKSCTPEACWAVSFQYNGSRWIARPVPYQLLDLQQGEVFSGIHFFP